MNRRLPGLLLAALLTMIVASTSHAEQVRVMLQTSAGDIELTLDGDKAPLSVANFLRYVDEGFYDGTIFHRVINSFMIQGGGFTPDLVRKRAHAPVKNEAKNGLKNRRGTIAMARTADPHSATAQFFINHADNSFLDFPGQDGWGYAVFGEVTAGMETVDKIADVYTVTRRGMASVPETAVVIERVTRVTAEN